MPLPLIVDNLDTVPEPLRANYVQSDGKYRLDVDDTEIVKTATSKANKEAAEFRHKLKSYADLGKTPEEIQAILEAQQRAEEDKAMKGGEFDKLRSQMLTAHQAELGKKDGRIDALTRAIHGRIVDADATAAIAAAKGVPALLLPHVRAQVKVVEEDGEFVARVVDQAGNPRVNGKGDFLSIADLVSEMRQSDVFGRAFEPTGTTGSGATGSSGGGGSKTMTEAAFNALPPKAKAARMAEGYRIV